MVENTAFALSGFQDGTKISPFVEELWLQYGPPEQSLPGGSAAEPSELYFPSLFENALKTCGGYFDETLLLPVAEQSLTIPQPLWKETDFADFIDEEGRLAGAASVSWVLEQAGAQYAHSASVLKLVDQLSRNGWEELGGLEFAEPGTVIYGDDGGAKNYVGIIGRDNNGKLAVYDSGGQNGSWRKVPLDNLMNMGLDPDEFHVLKYAGC